MQYPMFRMPAFAGQVVRICIFFLVKTRAPIDELSNPFRAFLHNDAHYVCLAKSVTRIEGVRDMFLKIVLSAVPNRCHATLGIARVVFPFCRLRQDENRSVREVSSRFDGESQSGDAGTED
jgi:hypothetical protein